MLAFAVEYRLAIDLITGDRDMKLRHYELNEDEWAAAIQLCEALKVHNTIIFYSL